MILKLNIYQKYSFNYYRKINIIGQFKLKYSTTNFIVKDI